MPLRHSSDNSQSDRASRLRHPPQYGSRVAQLRLMVLVAALMAVLVAMNEARKPANWRWLWSNSPRPAAAPAGSDTSAEPPASAGANEGGSAVETAERPTEESASDTTPRQRVWQQLYRELTLEQQSELGRLLRTARLSYPVPAADAATWEQLVEQLDERWARSQELSAANKPLPGGDAPELARRLESQRQQERQSWAEDRAALLSGLAAGSWNDVERQVLAGIQDCVDQQALAQIRDDMVWRPEERQAWFRIFERLQHTDPQQLAAASAGDVSYLQLFRQSPAYRGRVVSVRGTARLGYWVSAPPNELGIQRYAILWIRPADQTNRPIAVYALELPRGFPTLGAGVPTSLEEAVEVSGIYFKRLLYRAHDGLNSAPLVLARIPVWSPGAAPEESRTRRLARMLGRWFWVATAVLLVTLAAAAAGIALLIGWSSRSHEAINSATKGASRIDWTALPPTKSVEQSLRDMAEREKP